MLYKVTYFGNAVNYGSEQFFMCPMFVTECFHNKCLNCQPCVQFIFSPGCESDMILSVMTINKALLESIAQITEMTKSDHPTTAARVKLADKMVMLPLLFDGTKPEVVKQHYERFNQYIKFHTKSCNIRDPVGKAIKLFKHTLDKKAVVWFQEHKDKFVDLTTLKTMFLQRYNAWGKTKRDQLQSWNILVFDPQKMDVDEHIDLINTLGDILGQTAESKMEKFIDTMPIIIQTHLITKKTWKKTTDKVKELEYIIRKCDPPAAALPNLTKDTAVPSLYSHIAHSDDKEETDIPPTLQRSPS